MTKFILSVLLSGLFITATASDPYPKNDAIDIQHYKFSIQLYDTTNVIDANAEISILIKKPISAFSLDLIEKTRYGYGMSVSAVTAKGKPLKHLHQNGRLQIDLGSEIKKGDSININISYKGHPAQGLVISANKFGDRTFFGDNWPDKARNWLPTIDHPYDKATCEFIIIAPDHYQAIANGVMVERTNLPNNRILTHWEENIMIPTKVMVIGVARFAITTSGAVDGIPVETWVYPQNKEAGFSDFKIAPQVLKYFTNEIAPFPYRKLANVQSTTSFGGMENASNIFYFENSVTGKNEREGLIAHEIAHQWFGDSASELDWHHVWLSEGFATYFTNMYYEHTYGKDSLMHRMKTQREKVVRYYSTNQAPVVDTTITDISKVLSTNTYQKASWVLHMLRREVGNEAFLKGIRTYYNTFKNGNALTDDFRVIMEKASGKNLELFFHQWLWKAGHPNLTAQWSYDDKKGSVQIRIRQNQSNVFRTALEIGVVSENGSVAKHTVQLSEKESEFSFSSKKRPKSVLLDPDIWLLYTGNIQMK